MTNSLVCGMISTSLASADSMCTADQPLSYRVDRVKGNAGAKRGMEEYAYKPPNPSKKPKSVALKPRNNM